MKIVLDSPTSLTLRDFQNPDFEVESRDPEAHFSALPMFHVSLGLCTYSVVAEYGRRFDAPAEGLEVQMEWEYAEDPYRVGRIDMDIRWPGLPESRVQAVERAAAQCTIHNTLHHPPEMETRVHSVDD